MSDLFFWCWEVKLSFPLFSCTIRWNALTVVFFKVNYLTLSENGHVVYDNLYLKTAKTWSLYRGCCYKEMVTKCRFLISVILIKKKISSGHHWLDTLKRIWHTILGTKRSEELHSELNDTALKPCIFSYYNISILLFELSIIFLLSLFKLKSTINSRIFSPFISFQLF